MAVSRARLAHFYTMHISILLPQTHPCRDLEQSVFAFANRLSGYCGSIESCGISIESSTAGERQHPAFTVKVALNVFGEAVVVMGKASAEWREDAMAKALNDAFSQASRRLEAIANAHIGCGCERESACG